MKRWQEILDQSVELYDLADVQEIDATEFDRIQANQHTQNARTTRSKR